MFVFPEAILYYRRAEISGLRLLNINVYRPSSRILEESLRFLKRIPTLSDVGFLRVIASFSTIDHFLRSNIFYDRSLHRSSLRSLSLIAFVLSSFQLYLGLFLLFQLGGTHSIVILGNFVSLDVSIPC